jgi:hypothetical protein
LFQSPVGAGYFNNILFSINNNENNYKRNNQKQS